MGHRTLTLALALGAAVVASCAEQAAQPVSATGTPLRAAAKPVRIAIARASGGIAVIDARGTRIATLTGHKGWIDTEPAWSPDGSRIVFTRTMDNYGSFHLYVMRTDGTHVRRITSGRYDFRPAWSPDGRWIAYQSTTGLRIVHPDGSGGRRIRAGSDAAVSHPSWTLDGRIAFTIHADWPGDWPASCKRTGSGCGWVSTARLDGSDRRRVVKGRDAHWSPDGRTIVFTPPDGGVATLPAKGGRSRFVTKGYQARWLPDGRIVYARMGRGDPADGSVWVMNRDGSGRRRIAVHATMPGPRP